MTDQVEFKEWPKIPRGQNEIVSITEKINGTNACIIINDSGQKGGWTPEGVVVWFHHGRRYEKHTFKTPEGKWADQ